MKTSPRSMGRRSFFGIGMATTGMALGGVARAGAGREADKSAGMRYRPLGATGLKVSEISFGSYGFDNAELLSAALDAGINFVCTCADYQDGRAEEAIGKAIAKIGKRREELVLFSGTSIQAGKTKQDILETLDQSLRRLRTDRIEVFRTHSVEDPRQLKLEELFAAFETAKKAGKVQHLGLSGHGRKLRECLNTAVDDGRFGVILCKYDFASYSDLGAIFERAARKGIGTAVFKVSAGERQKEIRDLEAQGGSFRRATVRWALSNPNVSSFCAGITNFGEIDEYCGAVGQKVGDVDQRILRRYAEVMSSQYCRNCGTCETSCPRGVAVADVMRYAMYFKHYRREKDSMRLYAGLPRQKSASACRSCDGRCEGACPYGRKIRAGLVEAHGMLT